MRTCETCKYWSDKIAWKPEGAMHIEALCLNDESPRSQEYTPGTGLCGKYEPGPPIDEQE